MAGREDDATSVMMPEQAALLEMDRRITVLGTRVVELEEFKAQADNRVSALERAFKIANEKTRKLMRAHLDRIGE